MEQRKGQMVKQENKRMMKRKMRQTWKRLLAGAIAFALVATGNAFVMTTYAADPELLYTQNAGKVNDAENVGNINKAEDPENAENIVNVIGDADNAQDSEDAEMSDNQADTEDAGLGDDIENADPAYEQIFDENSEEEPVETQEDSDGELLGATIASGFCGANEGGENLTWKITGTSTNYTLTISGTGAMADYELDSYSTDAPWFDYLDKVKKIVIENGVSTIGYQAFAYAGKVETVEIPTTVTSVGVDAFYYCEALKSITIPSSVTIIRSATFCGCSALTTVSLPNGITKIDYAAFNNCVNLKNINVPTSLRDIGESAFSGCTSMPGIVLPEGLKTIGEYAFNDCDGFTKLNIPSTCTSLGRGAFLGCGNITGTITIPSGTSVIPALAFDGCEKIEKFILPFGLQTIGESAFYSCQALKSINIPETVTSIGKSAFSLDMQLQEIEIPAGITTIKWGTFMSCTKLERVTIPSSVTKIEENAFKSVGPYNNVTGQRDRLHVYYGGSENSWREVDVKTDNDSLLLATIHYARDPETILAPTPVSPLHGAMKASIVENGFRKFELKLTSSEKIESFDVARGSIRICRFDTGEKVWELRYNNLATLSDNVFSTTIHTGDLDYNTKYYILLDDDFFWLEDKDKCLGIHDKHTWVFTTQRSAKIKEIILKAGEGSVSEGTLYTNENGKLDSIPEATIDDGRRFGGWFTDPNFGEKVDTSYVFTDDATIYARYFANNEIIYTEDMAPVNNTLKYYQSVKDFLAFHITLSQMTKSIIDLKTAIYLGLKEGAFCYGASCAIVAAKMGSLSLDKFGANTFHDLDFSRKDVRSLMTIYQLQQNTNAATNEQYRFGRLSDAEKLQNVVNKARNVPNNGPAVLVIETEKKYENHAIVIDGLQEGNCAEEGYYYTVKTYDINIAEGVVNSIHSWKPSYSYLYISQDYSKWTMNNAVYFPTMHGTPIPASMIKMCFNDEHIINSHKYMEPSLIANFISVSMDTWINASVTIDGNTYKLSELNDTTDLFVMSPIGGDTEDEYKVFLPDEFSNVGLFSEDDGVAATFRFQDANVSVQTDSEAVVNATPDLDQLVVTGSGTDEYAGDYKLTTIADEENGATVSVEGSTRGDVTFERSGDEYVLSADGSHNSTITIDQNGITDRYPCVNQVTVMMKKDAESDRVCLYSDENEDGTYETQLQPVDGLWASNVKDLTYTGKAVTQPELLVFHDNLLLKEGTDYTVKYKNNTTAYTIADMSNLSKTDKSKAPSVTITGKGSYSGNATVYFSILPAPINSASVMTDRIVIASNAKKGVAPNPELQFGGKALKAGKDFTVTYYTRAEWDAPENGMPTPTVAPIKTAGEYVMQIQAVVNSSFTGTHDQVVPVIITDADETVSLSARTIKTVGSIPNVGYTGAEVNVESAFQGDQPSVRITDGEYALQYGEDFKISKYVNAVKPGKATVVIAGTGKKNATTGHSYVGEMKIGFTIVSVYDMKNAVVENVAKTYVYPGSDVTIDTVSVKLPGYKGGEPLDPAEDYAITYSGNGKPGKAKMTISGKGMLYGSKTVDFTIVAYSLTDETAGIEIAPSSLNADGKVTYHKGGCKPEVIVTRKDGKGTLAEGRDFTVKYSNNAQCYDETGTKKTPRATITGKGNYKGSLYIEFLISPGPLSACTMTLDDKVASAKKGGWVSVPKVTDPDGKVLKSKTDYHQNVIYATDPEFENQLDVKSILNLPAGADSATVYVKVTGIGNYAGTEPACVLTGSYRVVRNDISKATVDFVYDDAGGKSFKLTGKDITPGKNGTAYADAIIVTFGKTKTVLNAGEDYEIVGYENNNKTGTAKITIRGAGAYGGNKTASFKIGTRSFTGINLKRIRDLVALLFD